MAPELIVALVSMSCGVLLVVGSLIVGRATAAMAFRRKHAELQAAVSSLQSRLQEAGAKADAARAETEALRLESDERVSSALGSEMAKSEKTEQALEDAEARVKELRTKLAKAEAVAEEADKEFTVVRDKLDQTEKRLADAKRLLAEADESKNEDRVAELEKQLEEAKKTAAKVPTLEKERDQALRRIRELDKKPNEGARVRALEDKLKTAEATEDRLKKELQVRDERIEALEAASSDQADTEKLREELAAARERLTVSERVMEGVRARSNMLSQELKKAKAELAERNA